jgi:hypothetical protein
MSSSLISTDRTVNKTEETKKDADACVNGCDGGSDDDELSSSGSSLRTLFIISWVVLSIAAFIHSITCFAKQSGGQSYTTERVVGLLLALLFGPIYWIYYLLMAGTGYCSNA